jgi:hypothetical protein
MLYALQFHRLKYVSISHVSLACYIPRLFRDLISLFGEATHIRRSLRPLFFRPLGTKYSLLNLRSSFHV